MITFSGDRSHQFINVEFEIHLPTTPQPEALRTILQSGLINGFFYRATLC